MRDEVKEFTILLIFFYSYQVSNCSASVHAVKQDTQYTQEVTASGDSDTFFFVFNRLPPSSTGQILHSINLVYRNIDEQCLATTKLMLLSSVPGSIKTTHVLPRVWIKTHTYTL